MRRLGIAAAAIVLVLAILWTGGWFWAARWADAKAAETLTELAQRGVTVECAERTIVGFPFALRMACGATNVAEAGSGTRADFASLTGGASIFSPMTAEVQLASPATIESAPLGSARMQWEEASVDVGIGAGGPRDVSFDAEAMVAELSLAELPVEKISAAGAAATLAPSADGGTAISVAFSDLVVSAFGLELPRVTGTAAGQVSVPPRALLAGRAAIQPPIIARGIDVAIDSSGAKFRADGELSLDADGIVDGTIRLRVGGVESLPAFIASLPPAWQKIGNAVAGGLFAFGRPAEVDGGSASELTLEIERSNARIGPIEFALPPVRL